MSERRDIMSSEKKNYAEHLDTLFLCAPPERLRKTLTSIFVGFLKDKRCVNEVDYDDILQDYNILMHFLENIQE